jgi:deoxycytidine triphosphate deaminase
MPRTLDSSETRARVGDLIHWDTQKASVGLDLTVDAVFRVTDGGSLDFGGSEERAADREEMEPVLAGPDDDYGWWTLEPGSCLVRYNETLELEDGQYAHVLPLERLLRAGASHSAFLVDGSRDALEVLLQVGDGGCRLKENCRISRVVVSEG